jgi:hypothetical protein
MKKKPSERDETAAKLDQYKAKYKLRSLGGFGSTPCANTILRGSSRQCRGMHDECLPPKPVRDHHSGFRDKKGAIVAVFQPYISNHLEEISVVAQNWAVSKNLECRISVEDSWHLPGQTVLVEFRNPAVNVAKTRCGVILKNSSGTFVCEREVGHRMGFSSKHRQGAVTWTDAGAEREKSKR